MAVILLFTGTEDFPQQAPPPSAFSQEDNWWGGVQQCFASVALATALAITGLSTARAEVVANSWQDERIPQVVENYWQNPVPPGCRNPFG